MSESAFRPPAGDRPAARYDARLASEIELRWQQRWAADGTFRTPNPSGPLAAGFSRVAGLPKFFIMDMFPYPSGAGLHVGHPLGYIATDVYARYLRMTGHNVMHPFGYDAFGLPAEQYAIETGQHPAVTTQANIQAMRRQLGRLGLGHDTRREITTSDPSYYHWTQWIFLQIFGSWFDERAGRARPIGELIAEFGSGQREPSGEANPESLSWAELTPLQQRAVTDGFRLAYRSEQLVNWCPGLGTVLANEEITADGRSSVGNYPVYRRPLRQWVLRITSYAGRLLEDLDVLDWPESIKAMQRNWIGPSDGAEICFTAVGPASARIPVFTTRPDTLPGATYLVLAPEHPMADRLVAAAWPPGTPDAWQYRDSAAAAVAGPWTPAAAVRAYRQDASRLGERQQAGRSLPAKTGVFTGGYVSNPMTGAQMPVFLADYVLTGYGTGAIMAVPAHDGRDLEFARVFGLPVVPVAEPPAAWFTGHGIAPGTPAAQWPEAFTGPGSSRGLAACGLDVDGADTGSAVEAVIGWLEARGSGRRQRTYRLRDWLFSRQRYWGEPIPIVYDEHDLPRAVPEALLPVELPEMTDFRPEPQQDGWSDPVPPLARATGWAEAELDLGDGPRRYRRELSTMPQWAGSCWYYLRYLDPHDDARFVDPDVERYWMRPAEPDAQDGGVDLYVGGVEHAVLHLLYARFWHKVLYDLGYVSTAEPFRRLVNQGYILADAYLDEKGRYVPAAEVSADSGGQLSYRGEPVTARAGKMGKSLKNSVSPDGIYASYGADTLRVYEMAMGPLDTDRPWHTDDIIGSHRFLQRLWRNIISEQTGQPTLSDQPLGTETARLLHRTIRVIRADYASLRFNTAIARLTELNNHASALAAGDGRIPRALAEPLILMTAPLAPHIAEELWARLGHPASLAREPFPEAEDQVTADQEVVLPVMVDGKVRYRVSTAADAGEDDIRSLVTSHPDYQRHTGGRLVSRIVIVPGRIVNVVTRSSEP
jgi:leucyl-tRNA synthetase